ncbi:exo-alpha-sialidase, partial [Candidatus Thiosymbion oneisti]|uniref:exo-alpha-sialidase n=1 Tax=Candidatus Thiosymbion oneisti TaxID=589554 RepID=UPI00159F060B
MQWARTCNSPHWNPVLFAPRDSPTMLFFKEGCRCDHWRTWVTKSFDDGISWEKPSELVPGDMGGRGPVKTQPLCTKVHRLPPGLKVLNHSRIMF